MSIVCVLCVLFSSLSRSLDALEMAFSSSARARTCVSQRRFFSNVFFFFRPDITVMVEWG